MEQKQPSNRWSFLLMALGVTAFTAWFDANRFFEAEQKPVPAPRPNNYYRNLPEDSQNLIYPFDLKQGGQLGSPADPYQYAVGWQQELAKIKGIKRVYPVFWRTSMYIGIERAPAANSAEHLEVEIANLVKFRNDKVAEVYVFYEPELVQQSAELFEQRKDQIAGSDFQEKLAGFEAQGKKILEVPSI